LFNTKWQGQILGFSDWASIGLKMIRASSSAPVQRQCYPLVLLACCEDGLIQACEIFVYYSTI